MVGGWRSGSSHRQRALFERERYFAARRETRGERRERARGERGEREARAAQRRSGAAAQRRSGAAARKRLSPPPSNRLVRSKWPIAVVWLTCEIQASRRARHWCTSPTSAVCCLLSAVVVRTNGRRDDGRPRAGLAPCTCRSRSGRNPLVTASCGCGVFLFLLGDKIKTALWCYCFGLSQGTRVASR